MDPISVSLFLAGAGSNLLGGILGQNNALANATAQANARNAVVQSAIQKLNAFGAQNETTMSDLLVGYSAPAQTNSPMRKTSASRTTSQRSRRKTRTPSRSKRTRARRHVLIWQSVCLPHTISVSHVRRPKVGSAAMLTLG
jgi:hypothetical protein